jgi:hypothetical protein
MVGPLKTPNRNEKPQIDLQDSQTLVEELELAL